MHFRDDEDRRVFWNGVGCIVTFILGLVSTLFIVIILIIPVIRDGHIESQASCPTVLGNVHFELTLVQNGLDWKKKITSQGEIDSDFDKTLLQMIHDSQVGVFGDMTEILWCVPRGGVIVRGILKGASSPALFWIDPKRGVHYYGDLVP